MNYLESITDKELLQQIVMRAENVGRAKNKHLEKMARTLLNDAWLEMEKRLTLRAVDPPSALVGGGNSENSAGN